MSLNPAAKRLVSRYSKLNDGDKETFFERTRFNYKDAYKDARCIRSLIDWAAKNNIPKFLEKFLQDASNVNNTTLIDYIVDRIYQNRTILREHGSQLFHIWVGQSNFDCERACVRNTEVWDLKWIHNLIPHIKNEDVRYLAYNCVVSFCTPVTVESGFCNPENIIKPYYENLILCLICDPKCEDMIKLLNSDCKPSKFLETVSCGVQKQILQLHVGEASSIVANRKI